MIIFSNNDSFTMNLYNFFSNLTYVKLINIRSITQYNISNESLICFPPSGGQISDLMLSLDTLRIIYISKHILGICLGHQMILYFFGLRQSLSQNIIHGDIDILRNISKHIFINNIPFVTHYCRYNSITMLGQQISTKILMDNSNKEPMMIIHKVYPIIGIQFHPEAIRSIYGPRLIRNVISFLNDKPY
ncbi:glutamine amidotransferase-related protein [Candidatus Vidania fulgoroideorum]